MGLQNDFADFGSRLEGFENMIEMETKCFQKAHTLHFKNQSLKHSPYYGKLASLRDPSCCASQHGSAMQLAATWPRFDAYASIHTYSQPAHSAGRVRGTGSPYSHPSLYYIMIPVTFTSSQLKRLININHVLEYRLVPITHSRFIAETRIFHKCICDLDLEPSDLYIISTLTSHQYQSYVQVSSRSNRPFMIYRLNNINIRFRLFRINFGDFVLVSLISYDMIKGGKYVKLSSFVSKLYVRCRKNVC